MHFRVQALCYFISNKLSISHNYQRLRYFRIMYFVLCAMILFKRCVRAVQWRHVLMALIGHSAQSTSHRRVRAVVARKWRHRARHQRSACLRVVRRSLFRRWRVVVTWSAPLSPDDDAHVMPYDAEQSACVDGTGDHQSDVHIRDVDGEAAEVILTGCDVTHPRHARQRYQHECVSNLKQTDARCG